MDSQSIKEVFNELYSHLERLETQSTAILQFLKEKKRVTDKQLAPYLEQAGNAANVKWRAERVRMEYLLAQAPEESKPDKKTEKESAAASPEVEQAEQKSPEIKQKTSGQKEQEQAAEGSGERDDSKKQEKAASGDGSEVEHEKEEAAQAISEQHPKKQQDSSRPAEVKAEPVHEPSNEKKEGGQKVA